MNRCLVIVLTVVAVILAALPIGVGAQGDGPERTGLRPDAPPYGVHGPYWVGTMESIIEPDSERPLPVMVWYPALNPDGLQEEVSYAINYPPTIIEQSASGHALQDAAPAVEHGPYPVVIFSHGLWCYRLSAIWLEEHLASQGFVVVAPDHTDDTEANRGDQEPFVRILSARPKDITRAIDFAESLGAPGGALEGMVDSSRLAVVGHSFGGSTALAAAGARLDFDGFEANFCDQPGWDGFCSIILPLQPSIAQAAGLGTVPVGPWPSWGDSRVDAVVPLAPGVPFYFGDAGLAAVTVPSLIVVGSADTAAPADINAFWAHEHIGSPENTLVVLDGAEHSVFENACEATPWMESKRCSDPVWDMDQAHDLINHFITAFLLATLKDDAEAAAALAPDAVQFSGITYETTGF